MRALVIPPAALAALRPFLIELRKAGYEPRRLLLLDLGDVADAAVRVAPRDLHGELLCAVLEAWQGLFGERAVTGAEALRASRKVMPAEARRLDLALRSVSLATGHPLNPKRLGAWLRRHRQIESNGKCFFQTGLRDHTRLWGVRTLKA